MKTKFLLAGVVIAACATGLQINVQAQEPLPDDGDGKGMRLKFRNECVNPTPPFMIRVGVDKPNRVYCEGEKMTVTVTSSKDCHLYLLYFDAGGNSRCLFPHRRSDQSNFVAANTKVLVPDKKANFEFETCPPFGKEDLVAVATIDRVELLENLEQQGPTELKVDDLKKMLARIKEQSQDKWADDRIEITTCAEEPDEREPKRIAVCIGISQYQSKDIPQLHGCHKDAEQFKQALEQHGDVDEVILLTNEGATRAAIEQTLFRELPSKVKPGDTVFIFYSGHGWRVSDTNGDEEDGDGVDEVLVPHDGQFGKPETMIIDDTFARWMRELDGCHIGIIFDNCYSGGSSKGMPSKGLGEFRPQQVGLDFFDGEINRAKGIGQTGIVLLAACLPEQLAWEMPSGEGSVLSHYLLQLIGSVPEAEKPQQMAAVKQADANVDGKLSFGELYEAIKKPAEQYVDKTFSTKQTPVLLGNGDCIVVRP